MREGVFQNRLINKLKECFPGCIVLKTDSGYLQGVPDLLVMYGRNWAALEVKASSSAKRQPNQAYYIRKMNDMSYAAFVSPENEREVLDELQLALRR